MSHPREKRRPPAPQAAPATGQEPTLDNVLRLFAPGTLEEMMIEGFARAFERKMEGAGFESLTDALQLAADLRIFKEGLSLTGEQVCSLLQISERTFDNYKKRHGIEVDPHIGPGSHRYSLISILEARQKHLLEARPKR